MAVAYTPNLEERLNFFKFSKKKCADTQNCRRQGIKLTFSSCK